FRRILGRDLRGGRGRQGVAVAEAQQARGQQGGQLAGAVLGGEFGERVAGSHGRSPARRPQRPPLRGRSSVWQGRGTRGPVHQHLYPGGCRGDGQDRGKITGENVNAGPVRPPGQRGAGYGPRWEGAGTVENEPAGRILSTS